MVYLHLENYLINVTTGTTKFAGSEDDVSIVLVGKETATLELENDVGLQPGSTETFTLQGKDVGNVEFIIINKTRTADMKNFYQDRSNDAS